MSPAAFSTWRKGASHNLEHFVNDHSTEASLVASRAYWPSRFKADREVLLSALLAITMAAERMREPYLGCY